jgi:hypothetical protein
VSALQPGAAWFAPFDAQLLALFNTLGWADVLCARATALGIANAQNLPLRFVRQDVLPDGEPYEAFIHRTGCVPTRDNAHDFFNALMWLHLPRAKARLNALQAAEIARQGVGAQRGALRDFCTLLDESGLLVIAPPDMVALLRQRAWAKLLMGMRSRWPREVALLPFGHALLEKLLNPYKAITAQVLVWEALDNTLPNIHELFQAKMAEKADEYCVLMDQLLLQTLQDVEPLQPARLMPLPVLGIPGWWPANQAPAFYEDKKVFRLLPTQAA